jgi:hypothetical protein
MSGVGPLKFGMGRREVGLALRGCAERAFNVEKGEVFNFSGAPPLSASSLVSVYYEESGGLAGVAVDARNGPLVSFDGVPLVGEIPSKVEEGFVRCLEAREMELSISQLANFSSDDLGVVIRYQRVDDLALSRPVFVSRSWSRGCGDAFEGPIPRSEWFIF